MDEKKEMLDQNKAAAEPAAQTESAAEQETAAPAKKEKKAKKLKNVNLAKRSTFMILTGVILLVVLVLLNVVSVIIADRLPTTIDVTTDAANSLTKENIDFIKSIDTDVTVTVCAPRDGYTGTDMVNYAYNTYGVQENSTPYNYYNQTITLIESYSRYNSRIQVRYVDPQSPDFDTLESGNSSEISYGDIIVSANRGGKALTHIITFKDVYDLYDASGGYSSYGYSAYTITSSNIESQLSSAIYTVASSNRSTIALLTGHGAKEDAQALTDSLANYNYEITEISGKVTASALSNADLVLLVKPVSDLDGQELSVLDSFLDNNGKRGKSFVVFGSTASPLTPNLNDFMEEWGIGVQDGMAYETNDQNRNSTDQSIRLFNEGNDLTGAVNNSELFYFSGRNLALNQVFTEKGSRTSHILMSTSETAVVAPRGTSGGYTPPATEAKKKLPVVMLTTDTVYDENSNEMKSYVGYFASADFISAEWSNYTDIGNLNFATCVFNIASGRDGSALYFTPKVTGVFSASMTDSQRATVTAITLYVIPFLVLILGISVWVYRRVKH